MNKNEYLAPIKLKGFNRLVYRFVWLLCAPVVYLYWRVSIRGRENLKGHDGFIIAPVHRSYIDPVAVGLTLWNPIRPLAKEEFFQSKFAWLWRKMGGCPLRRGEADRNALRTAAAWLEAGEQVILFPEGTRKEGPTVENLHEGVAYLAVKTNSPVIPVGIGGSDKAMPKKAKFIYPAKITLEFGEPIYPDKSLKMREATAALTSELQIALQKTYDAAKARL